MTREHAQFIADRCRGTICEYSRGRYQVNADIAGLMSVTYRPDDGLGLVMNSHGWFIASDETVDRIKAVVNRFSTAITAAAADGFPDPRKDGA